MESIRKNPLEQELLSLCDAPLRALGFRIVDLDGRVAGRTLVRLFIDRDSTLPAEGTSEEAPSPPKTGVLLDDCATVSRLVVPMLDELPSIPGAYDLEVSSPGIDRRLRLRPDFEAAVGRTIRLKLASADAFGAANCTGLLEAVEGDRISVRVDAHTRAVVLANVLRAHIVWTDGDEARQSARQ